MLRLDITVVIIAKLMESLTKQWTMNLAFKIVAWNFLKIMPLISFFFFSFTINKKEPPFALGLSGIFTR